MQMVTDIEDIILCISQEIYDDKLYFRWIMTSKKILNVNMKFLFHKKNDFFFTPFIDKKYLETHTIREEYFQCYEEIRCRKTKDGLMHGCIIINIIMKCSSDENYCEIDGCSSKILKNHNISEYIFKMNNEEFRIAARTGKLDSNNILEKGKYFYGKLHGIYYIYFPNTSKLKHSISYSNGILHGICYQFYSNGNIFSIEKYQNGKSLIMYNYSEIGELISTRIWDIDGNVNVISHK